MLCWKFNTNVSDYKPLLNFVIITRVVLHTRFRHSGITNITWKVTCGCVAPTSLYIFTNSLKIIKPTNIYLLNFNFSFIFSLNIFNVLSIWISIYFSIWSIDRLLNRFWFIVERKYVYILLIAEKERSDMVDEIGNVIT